MDACMEQRQDRRAKYLRKGGHNIARPQFAVGDRVWVQDNHTHKRDIDAIIRIVRTKAEVTGLRHSKVQCT